MRTRVLQLTVLSAGVLSFGLRGQQTQPASRVRPIALRAEYLVNPLSIDTRIPRLSWILDASTARGVTQTAYQIEVASTPASLAAGKADLWDSGQTTSSHQNQIEYHGAPLSSRQQAFWKVRIWDQTGARSEWSKPATWSMGLLDKSDWSAQWIGDPLPSVDNVAATTLRHQFTLTAKPSRAVAYATALGTYELHLNGQRVGDHVLAPEFTDYRTRTQYQAYDVTSMLRAGDNVVAALLGDGWYAGGIGLAESLIHQPRNVYGDHPRFLTQVEIAFNRGPGTPSRVERIITDGTWRVTRDGPIRSSDILNGEIYDARKEMPGWDTAGFDDSRWAAADIASNVKTSLVAQPNEPVRVTQDLRPVALTEPKPGVYVFDLGQNMVGWARVSVRGAAGTRSRSRTGKWSTTMEWSTRTTSVAPGRRTVIRCADPRRASRRSNRTLPITASGMCR